MPAARELLLVLCFVLLASTARADITFPSRPAGDTAIVDEANLIQPADALAIDVLANDLRRDKGFPILVVTIRSLSSRGADGIPLESYARGLFDTWGIGRPDHNYGILLLVSPGDRKARIELGAAWSRSHDAVCQELMDGTIIPEFRAGRYSAGIRAGVEGLDKMARGERLPSKPSQPQAVGPSTGILSTIGKSCSMVILAPFIIIVSILNRLRRGIFGGSYGGYGGSSGGFFGGGGSSGGGSFGGGFSGGGGASGSW